MDDEKVISEANRILEELKNGKGGVGAIVGAQEFVRVYAGEKSSFYESLSKISSDALKSIGTARQSQNASQIIESFIKYVEGGMLEGISIERKAQIDVVSDFLSQAQTMLESKDIHPATSAMITGAALEEFLRNWVEEENLKIEGRPSIDSYAKTLRKEELITKQDMKDITSWAGIRNDAAHGNWDAVSYRERILLMLEGVNLFMRKYVQRS